MPAQSKPGPMLAVVAGTLTVTRLGGQQLGQRLVSNQPVRNSAWGFQAWGSGSEATKIRAEERTAGS